MNDAVDTVMENWRATRPDLDFRPLGTVARLMRLSRFIDRELKDFLGGYGLEPGEFDVLTTLRRSNASDGMTTSAFHKASLVTAGAITNRLDRMAAKGLIERIPDPHDRRVTRIVLTPQGT
ncbi:MAG: MarR family winged helix-turn-helix transcriptional regulator, partial [Stackebrandtia sp.]